MKTVLLAGGTGFIGSHTCVALMNAGSKVIILDNLSNSSVDTIGRIGQIIGREPVFYEGDMRDEQLLEKIFLCHKIDAVVHLAGLKAVGESINSPFEYYQNNLCGTLTLCGVMRKVGCRVMIFSSSATVYGSGNCPPYTEDMPLAATNPYGQTKLMIEQILRDIAYADLRWHIIALRYFNPIGAHESGLIGEKPNGVPNNLFPYLAEVACGHLPYLNIYGCDYDTPDGTGVRDYIHVSDLAEGHLSALKYAMGHTGFEAINLGTGRGYSVLEVLNAFEEASGHQIPYQFTERRSGDIASCTASVQKARKLLGWEAKRNMSDMCRDGWKFVSGN